MLLVRQTPSGAYLEIQLVKIAPQKIQLVNFLFFVVDWVLLASS
jgi:hypothetical protein